MSRHNHPPFTQFLWMLTAIVVAGCSLSLPQAVTGPSSPGTTAADIALLNNGTLWLIDSTRQCTQRLSLNQSYVAFSDTVAWSPDRTRLAWLALAATMQDGATSYSEVGYPAVLNITTGELRYYLDVPAALRTGIAWSADGTALYLSPGDFRYDQLAPLYRLDLTTEQMSPVLETVTDERHVTITGTLAVTKDGAILAPTHIIEREQFVGQWGMSRLIPDSGTLTDTIPLWEEPSAWRHPPSTERFFNTNSEYAASIPTALRPQGDVMAYTAELHMRPPDMDAGLYLVPVSGGTPRLVIDDDNVAYPLIWSPQGERLLVTNGAATVGWIYDHATGTTTSLTESPASQIAALLNSAEDERVFLSRPVWLDDARLIYVAERISSGSSAPEIFVIMDVTSGEVSLAEWGQTPCTASIVIPTGVPSTPVGAADPSALPIYYYSGLHLEQLEMYQWRMTLEFSGVGQSGEPAWLNMTTEQWHSKPRLPEETWDFAVINLTRMEYTASGIPTLGAWGRRSSALVQGRERYDSYLATESSDQPYSCAGTNSYDSVLLISLEAFISHADGILLHRREPNMLNERIDSRYYHAEHATFGYFTDATVDMWIVRDSRYAAQRPVTRLEINGQFSDPTFGTGSLYLLYELTKINQPIDIPQTLPCQ